MQTSLTIPEYCAYLSRDIYETEQAFRAALEAIDGRCLAFVACENHVAAVVDSSANRYVVFRGTDERRDWDDNLNVLWTKVEWGDVHRGFYRALQCVLPDLAPYLEGGPPGGLVLTGHSLGGAMATLAAAHVAKLRDDVFVVTFGQPAVGSLWFALAYRKILGVRHMRLVHGMDIVPQSPLPAHHVGRPFYFDVTNALRSPMWFGRFIDAVLHGLQRNPISGHVDDHQMERYVRLAQRHATVLERALPRAKKG